jgi:hypothetical protein
MRGPAAHVARLRQEDLRRMNSDAIDWAALERLRGIFLKGAAGHHDYWHSDGDLAAYDQTFGRRIGWKWDYVLGELARLGWSPPPGEVIDWACGSGVAGRAVVRHFGRPQVACLVLCDSSRLAVQFAARQARLAFPDLKVECRAAAAVSGGTLLVSHVITELSGAEVDGLAARASRAAAVIWVEPGTFEASRALVAVRERLRSRFAIIAPCTHQAGCGMLTPGMERHWCHHFADSPREAFTDARWARFARMTGIDLRSLPLSYLVLDRRAAPPLPAGTVRVIGRPRVGKAFARLCGCDAAGVRDRRLAKRAFPREFRQLKAGHFASLQEWQCNGDEIIGVGQAT